MSTPDAFLSSDEQDIALRLAAYHRKIVSIRAAVLPEAAEGLETPRAKGNSTRNRLVRLRSVAEDYRHARTVQRLLQGVCSSQMVLTVLLVIVAHQPILFAFLPGHAFGLTASFARVQRAHALCSVFNLTYLLASLGMPVVLLVARVQSGSAKELAQHIQRSHDLPGAVVAVGVLSGIASVLGAIMAAYVLA